EFMLNVRTPYFAASARTLGAALRVLCKYCAGAKSPSNASAVGTTMECDVAKDTPPPFLARVGQSASSFSAALMRSMYPATVALSRSAAARYAEAPNSANQVVVSSSHVNCAASANNQPFQGLCPGARMAVRAAFISKGADTLIAFPVKHALPPNG